MDTSQRCEPYTRSQDDSVRTSASVAGAALREDAATEACPPVPWLVPSLRRQHRSVPPTPDDVLRTVTRTMTDELTQPLTVLIATIELSRMHAYPPERLHEALSIVEQAASELARRLRRLAKVSRYETRTKAGYEVLDLGQAR